MEKHIEKAEAVAPLAEGREPRAPEQWEVDGDRSRLTFKLRHLVFHQIAGRFERWGGTLFLDRAHPSLSSVQVWVDLASINSDSPERDAHMTSAEFLEVTRFPRATFTSTTVEVRGSDVIINGRLDLHGVVRDIEVTARPATMPADARRGQRQSFSADAKINRQAFGLHWNQDLDVGGVVVGDQVDVGAHIEVVRIDDDI